MKNIKAQRLNIVIMQIMYLWHDKMNVNKHKQINNNIIRLLLLNHTLLCYESVSVYSDLPHSQAREAMPECCVMKTNDAMNNASKIVIWFQVDK